MSNFKYLIKKRDSYSFLVNSQVVRLMGNIKNICHDHSLDNADYIFNLPRDEEDLHSVEQCNGFYRTRWEYLEPYMPEGGWDSETECCLHEEWFDMEYEELEIYIKTEYLIKQKQYEEGEIKSLEMRANELGYTLEKVER